MAQETKLTTADRQGDPAPDEALLARVRRNVQDLDADPRAVRAAFYELGPEELRRFGFQSFYMNLLAVFGGEWDAERVAQTAATVTREKLWRGWEFYSYFTRLGHDPHEPPARPKLGGLNPEAVRRLAAERGLVVCTCHLGDYRYLPTDLALAGLANTVALDADGYAQQTGAQKATGEERFRKLGTLVNVEKGRGSLHLARTLARRGVVFAYLDGNTGEDGPLGEESRVEIDLLGYRAQVKTGIARLAARFGSPILPVLAARCGGRSHWRMGCVIHPGGRMKGAAQKRFADEAIADVYRFFEAGIRELPERWETGCFFHRWRVGASPAAGPRCSDEEARRRLETELAAGKVLRMNRRRIAEIRRGDERIWTDVLTLKAYRAPAEVAALLEKLSPAGTGIDHSWFAGSCAEDFQERALSFLSYLSAREALAYEVPPDRC